MISDVVANYNLDRNGVPQNQGDPVKRNYGLNWYEFYGQDTWRIKPNLTLTYGLRWSLFPPPWETNGLQTAPTFGLGTQFDKNAANMKQGLGYTSELAIAFNLGGPVNHGPGFYNFEKTDFSPRISIAYSPRRRTACSKQSSARTTKPSSARVSAAFTTARICSPKHLGLGRCSRFDDHLAESLLHV